MRQLIDFRVSNELRNACLVLDEALFLVDTNEEHLALCIEDLEWNISNLKIQAYYPMEIVYKIYEGLEYLVNHSDYLLERLSNEESKRVKDCMMSLLKVIREDCAYFNKHRYNILDSLYYELEWFTNFLMKDLKECMEDKKYIDFTILVYNALSDSYLDQVQSLESLKASIKRLTDDPRNETLQLLDNRTKMEQIRELLLRVTRYIDLLEYPSKIVPIEYQVF